MNLFTQLSNLEVAGLIALIHTDPDLEYIFRHTLIQDAAYDSLLKSERQQLHLIAGETLEQLYVERREEMAPRLAEHFWQAGDEKRALDYFLLAAESAARSYANAEAVDSYTHALKAASHKPSLQANIYQRRGNLYETMGEFELARADQEASLALAKTSQDLQAEWQALINLGLLWASRDYRKTGRYYRDALNLARQSKDERRLGYTLKWMGNYSTNIEQPRESLRYLQEALELFTRLEDPTGMVETLDLLGMANALGGDMDHAKAYLEMAASRYRDLGDRKGLSSVLSTLSITTLTIQTAALVPSDINLQEAIRTTNAAHEIAVQIGWRSGEAYSLCGRSLCLISAGQYDQALESVQEAIDIAKQINHRQWEIYAYLAGGMLYSDIFAYDQARSHLEWSLALARENHSPHWIHTVSGFLASMLTHSGDLAAADRLLDKVFSTRMPSKTLGERHLWMAKAEMDLARNSPEPALRIIRKLTRSAANTDHDRIIPYLVYLRGKALLSLASQPSSSGLEQPYLEDTEKALKTALGEAQVKGSRSIIWRLHQTLNECYTVQGCQELADQERSRAKGVLMELSENIHDLELRQQYLNRALVD